MAGCHPPGAIEDVFVQHESVRAVCVVGVPDEVKGEEIIACIEIAGDHSDQDSIRRLLKEYSKSYLPQHQRPEMFLFLEELPRGVSGKVLKPQLMDIIMSKLSIDEV